MKYVIIVFNWISVEIEGNYPEKQETIHILVILRLIEYGLKPKKHYQNGNIIKIPPCLHSFMNRKNPNVGGLAPCLSAYLMLALMLGIIPVMP